MDSWAVIINGDTRMESEDFRRCFEYARSAARAGCEDVVVRRIEEPLRYDEATGESYR